MKKKNFSIGFVQILFVVNNRLALIPLNVLLSCALAELKIMKRVCTNTYPFQSNQKGVPGQTKIN